ncbi:unnamed protein product [Rhizoctonia solani]|uniref:Uncharacterized protein n=1 Tax=Rhizoctonia solani TaxID=456999 RepID=A0A8H3D1R2_9AGAM|nr:unnamed protein product [Rhizoctonia solani]CAE6500492.1 unnamed protein product [Rhizoctonia solani]
MGYISDRKLEFEDEQGPINPPQSPQLAATHAQAIAEKVASLNSGLGALVLGTRKAQSMGGTQQGWPGKFREMPGVALNLAAELSY